MISLARWLIESELRANDCGQSPAQPAADAG